MGPDPHDALVRAILGRTVHADGQIRLLLPSAVVAALDFSTLAAVPGSFVDQELQDRHTDLLFTVRWRDGEDVLVYLLLEHQSTVDPGLPLRLLVYMTRIWERWRRDHPREAALPAILPLVLYNGREPWPGPRSFREVLGVPAGILEAISPRCVDFEFVVDDLSSVDDDELRHRAVDAVTRCTLFALKHARHATDLERRLLGWVDVMREAAAAPGGREAWIMVMRYVSQVSRHLDLEVLRTRIVPAVVSGAVGEDDMPSGPELIEQGVRQGMRQGMQHGIVVGARQTVRRLLELRFGSLPPEILGRIDRAGQTELDRWLERIAAGASLEECFAD